MTEVKQLKLKLTVMVVLGVTLLAAMLTVSLLTISGSVLGEEQVGSSLIGESAMDSLNRLISNGNRLQFQVREVEEELQSYKKGLEEDQKLALYQNKLILSEAEINRMGQLSGQLSSYEELNGKAALYSNYIYSLRDISVALSTAQLDKDLSSERRTELIESLEQQLAAFPEVHTQFMNMVLEQAAVLARQNPNNSELGNRVAEVYSLLLKGEEYITVILSKETPGKLPLADLQDLLEFNQQLVASLPAEIPTDDPNLQEQYSLVLVSITNLHNEMSRLHELAEKNELSTAKFYEVGDSILTAYNEAISDYNQFNMMIKQ